MLSCSFNGGLHEIHNDSSDRNIEPDGKGVAGDSAVLREALREREKEGDEDHRQSDDGQEDVRDEKRDICMPESTGMRNG